MRKIITIGELGSIITGNTPPRSNPELYGHYTPFIKATDISETEKYTYNPEEYYSKEGHDKYVKSLIPKGATCVVTIGSIGKKMTMAHCDLFINQAMNAIIPNKNFDKEYVYYAVKNILPNIKMLDSGTASGRENVSKSAFSKMEILIEDNIVIQQRIAEILSRYDSLIENYQKQIKLLEEAAQRLYKEWFVDLRFPGYEDTKIVDGLPEGWSFIRIKDRYKTVLGGTPSRSINSYWGGDISWINSGEINKLRIIKPSEEITQDGYKNSSTKLMPIHTTILAITGATLGQVSYTEIETCANQSVVGIIDEENTTNEFLYLNIYNNIHSMINKATGGAQQHINKDIVSDYFIMLPDESILIEFRKRINPIFNTIRDYFFIIEDIIEARDRLLPKLMSGEIEVKTLN